MLLKPISFMRKAAAGNFAGLTYSSTGRWDGTTSGATWTTHAFDVGTAFSDRVCYAFIHNRFGETFSSCTIGGVTATAVATTSDTAPGAWVDCYKATVPTGTTAVVAYTVTGAFASNSGVIDLLYARDCTETNINSSTTPADPWQFSINPAAGSSMVGAHMGNNNGGDDDPAGVNLTFGRAFEDIAGNDFSVCGHTNSVSTGAANYGFDMGSAAGNGAIIVFEVSQA